MNLSCLERGFHILVLPLVVAALFVMVLLSIGRVAEPDYLAFLTLDASAMVVTSIFIIVLRLDTHYRIKSRCCVWVLTLILLCFISDTCGLLFWKAYLVPRLVFVFFNLGYYLASFTVALLVYALRHFIDPDRRLHDIYLRITIALVVIEGFLLLQNIATHNLWWMDGGSIVHGNLYVLMFLAPVTENLLYLAACLHLSRNKRIGLLFFGTMVFSILGIILMLPRYYTTIHYLLTLFPCIVVIPYLYHYRGDKLVRMSAELDKKQYTQSVSRIFPEDLSRMFDDLSSQDFISQDVAEALGKLKLYITSNLRSINDVPLIPVEKELEHVRAYLYLEKLRYKDRLDIVYDVHCTDFEVPPLTIQILAENAVKHGLARRPQGGTLRISILGEGESRVIVVTDGGVGFDTSAPMNTERSHVGIANLRTRVANTLGGSMDIESVIGSGTTVTVTLPRTSAGTE
ncbi:MAG: histidine kinase [archaeon]|nr:histidine kinase [archaeon]